MDIAQAVAEDNPIHALSDKAHIQMPVLYMSSEDMRTAFNTRYNMHWPKNLEFLNFRHYETVEECLDEISEKIESINSSCLIIIDSITSIFDNRISPNKVLFFMNILKIILFFVKNIEKSPLLLGKLMISSKGWLWPDAITMPVARLWEKAVFSTPPAPTWLQGKQGKL